MPRQRAEKGSTPEQFNAPVPEGWTGQRGFIEPAIGQRRAQFRQQQGLIERPGAGQPHDMLRQHIQPAGAKVIPIARRGRLQAWRNAAGGLIAVAIVFM